VYSARDQLSTKEQYICTVREISCQQRDHKIFEQWDKSEVNKKMIDFSTVRQISCQQRDNAFLYSTGDQLSAKKRDQKNFEQWEKSEANK
jgi:hypothetical protein